MTTTETPTGVDATDRDGQHDFDFLHGSWEVALRRLTKPLSGSTEWVDYEGTSDCRPIWGGRANIDEFLVHSPATGARLDGLTLRLYNVETREWSLYWANAANGALSLPPTVGRFSGDRGEFFDHEDFEGRPIIVRYRWSDITPTAAHFEQAFSTDDGATWEPNWISTMTRVSSPTPVA